ncbi:hypothetical protein OH77DRAFT_1514309 [Trametes cingulata]|nr:hypothetical protein OH77DRAFT_1514309 [Trametes cingulata]
MSNLNPTYGALFVGVLLSAVLFGVTMLQTFVYFQQYASDRAWRKLAVCWLWFLDALHLALCAHLVYYYLVTNYDRPDTLSDIVWSFKLRTVVDALVVCSVHTLYTSRLWTLLAIDDHVEPFGKEARRWSRQKRAPHASATRWVMRRVVPWLVSALVVVGYGIAIAMCFEAFKLSTYAELSHAPWATYVPLAASTVVDAVIAGSLCYFLARCRPQSGAMNGPIKTLMVYTLNTGIITSLCSLFAISMMVAYPTTFIPIAIEFLVIKLYINSYMAMLNARTALHPSHPSHTSRHTSRTRTHTHRHTHSRPSFLPAFTSSREREQKHPPLPLPLSPSLSSFPPFPPESFPFPASLARFPLSSPTSLAYDGIMTAHGNGNGNGDAGLMRPRLSHPDVCPQYGALETAVGVALPTLSLSFVPPHPHPHAPAHVQASGGRFQSFTSASSSATAASPGSGSGSGSSVPLLPLSGAAGSMVAAAAAKVYARPVDPLCVEGVRPPAVGTRVGGEDGEGREGRDVEEGEFVIVEVPLSARNQDQDKKDLEGHADEEEEEDPPEYPSPPDRALSPLRFASYSSSSHPPDHSQHNLHSHQNANANASPYGSLSAASASASGSAWASSPSVNLALPPRPSRPRLGSAYSTEEPAHSSGVGARESGRGSAGGLAPAMGGSAAESLRASRDGSVGGRRYTRMVSEAREWRRGGGGRGVPGGGVVGGDGGEGAGGGGMEDERGVWVWGGPGGRGSLG